MPTPRKSEEAHFLTGTKSQAKKDSPPAVVAGRPKYPAFLKPHQRAEFKKLTALLEERRTATPGDALLLAQAAVLSCRWREALEKVAEHGLVIESTVLDAKGNQVTREKKNPFLSVAQESEKALLAILDRLGLVPLSRDKVKAAAPPEAKPQLHTVGWLLEQGEEK
jgi:P27 family predicted phage terminase small subunit